MTMLFRQVVRLLTHPAAERAMTLVFYLKGWYTMGAGKAPLITSGMLRLRVVPVKCLTLSMVSVGPVTALLKMSPAPGLKVVLSLLLA